MLILGNTAFGHLESDSRGKHMLDGPSDDRNSVAVMLDFKNDSVKTIENISFFFLALNALNRVVTNKARKAQEKCLRLLGIIQPNEIKRHVYWENVWFSREIVYVRLTRINIAYTDGSTESLSGQQIHFDYT